ncbi:hypothetical protein GQ600_1838 [Phytophthora cactorum]|nr:hypothetical protein GQ600_1838 [Phytophthora cactorum]
MVDGLEECLQNPDYRMSRELVELKVSPNRIFRHHRLIIFEPEYVTSLMQHNKEFLPVAKKKLPQSSRCALISVIQYQRCKLNVMLEIAANDRKLTHWAVQQPENTSKSSESFASMWDVNRFSGARPRCRRCVLTTTWNVQSPSLLTTATIPVVKFIRDRLSLASPAFAEVMLIPSNFCLEDEVESRLNSPFQRYLFQQQCPTCVPIWGEGMRSTSLRTLSLNLAVCRCNNNEESINRT